MSFTLEITKNAANRAQELKKFSVWMRDTNADGTVTVGKPDLDLIPIHIINSRKKIVVKRRGEEYAVYGIQQKNEFGEAEPKDFSGRYYFQFLNPDQSSSNTTEFSLTQTFDEIITNRSLNSIFSFTREVDVDFYFNIKNEEGENFFEKKLSPFIVSTPTGTTSFVQTSVETFLLNDGIYLIDDKYFFKDSTKQLIPNAYYFSITI